MVRKLLTPGTTAPALATALSSSGKVATPLSPEQLIARLRMKRSASYMDAMLKLDAGSHLHNQQAIDALVAAINDEFPDISIDQYPVGIVAKCYLGPPYEVHTLDRMGNIIQHYKHFESLPPLLARGRALAVHAQYAFVEVYTDKVIAVTASGDTSIVKG
ncbi:hypothetical protein KZJ38_01050 [Paraburkholderia edwinii]|uniref:Uncharacterized protein n=1 Tax=Paraburkholderia edwinii TaxID=2861782 RepID=A0ABX8UJJ1_9BURK|nr:hypothetical protein [Paraburkholderia edwinii]QYD69019.1 hypothetical protein KZJ38_01050 [Paraburkholderia edwinii]